jgi:hypothetical protein
MFGKPRASVERSGGYEGAASAVRGDVGRARAESISSQPVIYAHGLLSVSVRGSNTGDEFKVHASATFAPVRSSLDDGGGQLASAGDDNELTNLLPCIAAEVQRMLSGMCQAIVAEYAGKIAYARQSLPRDQAAGAVSALKAAQQAALAMARQSAAAELTGRREATISAHRRPFCVVRGGRSPFGRKLPEGPNRK